MLSSFGLWVYDGGWQVLVGVALGFVVLGLVLGIVWNTSALWSELSGRTYKRDVAYVRSHFREMQVGTVVSREDMVRPLDSHAGSGQPVVQGVPGVAVPGVGAGVGVEATAGAGIPDADRVVVNGVTMSRQQADAVKNEILADMGDDEPATGLLTEAANETGDAVPNEVKSEKAAEASGETMGKPAKESVEVPVAQKVETAVQEPEPMAKPAPVVNNTVKPAAPQPIVEAGTDNQKAGYSAAIPPEPATQEVGYSTPTPVEPVAQDSGYSDSSSDESPTGVFTPAEDVASDEKSTGTFEEQDSEGVTKDFSDATTTETAESEALTGYFSGGLSGSAVDISGAGLYVELMSTGSYDPATDSVIAGNDSRDDAENVTGFLS